MRKLFYLNCGHYTLFEKYKEQDKKINIGHEEKEKIDNNDDILLDSAPSENLTLDEKLNNCLNATLNSLEKETDEKTLSFFTLSEFLHTYGDEDYNILYAKFDNVFDKEEFKNIIERVLGGRNEA